MPLKNIRDLESQFLLGTYNRYEVLIDRGSGAYLIDRSNKRYLDLLSGIGVNALGYNHPRILRLLRKQIKRPLHISNLLYHEYQGRLAQRLAGLSGLDRVFFTNSGAESVEGALKFARVSTNTSGQAPRKFRVLAVEGAFHGRTMGSLSATWETRYRSPFEPLVPGFEFVRFDDVADLERRLTDDVAAVLIETVQGEGGVRPMSEEFYRRARQLTREAGAVLVADEVQCGLGRTGRWLACHKFAPTDGDRDDLPDLVTIAKPLGGGIPMGAVLMKEEIARTIDVGTHGTTFGGGPLACRVSLETLGTIEDENILGHVREVGAHFRARLEELASLPTVREVRGDGLMLAVELRVPGRPIVERLLEAGFIANVTRQTVLRFLPPLIIRRKQIDRFIVALRGALESEP
jgi:acetylornithine aminotransferase/acetylornithine/N-succinyldiaminopimelate aminotransferase